jgi:hypothetical protein
MDKTSKMLRLCLVLIFFISCNEIYVSSVIVPFVDCGSKSVTVQELDFDCEDGEPKPCKFIKGNTYHGNFSFTTTAEVAKGQIVIHAIIGGLTLPFPFDHPDICSNHNLTCPMASGANEVLTINLKVPAFVPSTNLVAKFEIKPTKGSATDIMCVEFLGEIVDSNYEIII